MGEIFSTNPHDSLLYSLVSVSTVFKIVLITGQSMSPTLQNGERILAWTPFSRKQFKRGVIVTLSHIQTYTLNVQSNHYMNRIIIKQKQSELFIKRLIGLPGDTVIISVAELSQQTLLTVDSHARRCGSKLMWHVPNNHVFVRGDGIQSNDSIMWEPVPFSLLKQIVLCRFPSFKEIT
ncbi:Signal peptidase I [hydrothermal vent metagenome]|uniref:Signal peptidase I n=1 Tax=hydrothermal vent metagenome TaxID=652676 RepID=A0A3B1AKL2_9ZZZZ